MSTEILTKVQLEYLCVIAKEYELNKGTLHNKWIKWIRYARIMDRASRNFPRAFERGILAAIVGIHPIRDRGSWYLSHINGKLSGQAQCFLEGWRIGQNLRCSDAVVTFGRASPAASY